MCWLGPQPVWLDAASPSRYLVALCMDLEAVRIFWMVDEVSSVIGHSPAMKRHLRRPLRVMLSHPY